MMMKMMMVKRSVVTSHKVEDTVVLCCRHLSLFTSVVYCHCFVFFCLIVIVSVCTVLLFCFLSNYDLPFTG